MRQRPTGSTGEGCPLCAEDYDNCACGEVQIKPAWERASIEVAQRLAARMGCVFVLKDRR